MTHDFNFFDKKPTKTEEKQSENSEASDEVVIDLANVKPEKREIILAGAKASGMKVKNEHLVHEIKSKKGAKEAMLLEFPQNPPSQAQGMTPLFRMCRRKDLDILFCGLNIGPVFQDQIEKAVKEKHSVGDSPEEVFKEHFVVFIYLAIALPFGDNENMNSGWSLTFLAPKQFERIIPKALRTHLDIDIWHKQVSNRFDVIYYKVQKVKSKEDQDEAIDNMKKTAALAYALTTANAPYPEIPKQSIDRWVEEYYEKNPNERPINESSEEVQEVREVQSDSTETATTSQKEVAKVKKPSLF